jgi:hypothetical protein
MKFNNEARKEGKGGSQSAVDRVNARVKTDVDDKLNVVGTKKMSACSKALRKMKK